MASRGCCQVQRFTCSAQGRPAYTQLPVTQRSEPANSSTYARACPTSGFPPFFFLLLCFFSCAGAAVAAAAAGVPPSPPAAPPSPTASPAIAPDTPASCEAFHRLNSSQSLGRYSLNSEGTPAEGGRGEYRGCR